MLTTQTTSLLVSAREAAAASRLAKERFGHSPPRAKSHAYVSGGQSAIPDENWNNLWQLGCLFHGRRNPNDGSEPPRTRASASRASKSEAIRRWVDRLLPCSRRHKSKPFVWNWKQRRGSRSVFCQLPYVERYSGRGARNEGPTTTSCGDISAKSQRVSEERVEEPHGR